MGSTLWTYGQKTHHLKKSLSNSRRLIPILIQILLNSSAFKRKLSLRALAKQSLILRLLRRFASRNAGLGCTLLKNRMGIRIAIFLFLLIISCQSENSPVFINKGTEDRKSTRLNSSHG